MALAGTDPVSRRLWHLKETPAGAAGEIKDSTGNANNGTGEVAPTSLPTQTPGKIDGSLSFVPNVQEQNVNVPNSASLQLAANMTIEAWVQTSNADVQPRIIVAKWRSGQVPPANNYWLGKLNNSTYNFYVDGSQTVAVGVGLISDGFWHHVVGVADAASGLLRFYVDAVQLNTAAYTGTSRTGNFELRIGKSPDGTLQLWAGGIDEVRISDAARSAGWIQTEYRNQSSPSPSTASATAPPSPSLRGRAPSP